MNFYEFTTTSAYGERTDPFTNEKSFHNGVDYALPLNTDVISNVKGWVSKVGTDSDGFGNYIEIFDGLNTHTYAHLNSVSVKEKQHINVGDVIGLSGSTGRSTGAHLHYEVRNYTGTIDPSKFIENPVADSFSVSGSILGTSISGTGQYSGEQVGLFDNIKDKLKMIVFYIFKFIIMAMLIILFVVFVTKSLDISLI